MKITRRALLNAAFAGSIAPWCARIGLAASLPRETDVAVVGAGAAGIAAARRVAAAGRRVVVIEAAARVGGRCATDATTFGAPIDLGAHWLYSADTHPLTKLARPLGLDIVPAPRGQKVRIGRRNARDGEMEDFLAALVRANRAITEASRGKADIACQDVLPKDLGEWQASAQFMLGPSANGRELSDISAMDFVRAAERTGESYCRQGLGALLEKLAGGLTIVAATPVTRIVWNNRNAEIETSAGTLTARAVIVTASTNVLAAGKIKFAPELPKRYLDAAVKLPLGTTERIILDMPGNPLGLSRDDVIIEQSDSRRTGSLHANIGGSTLCAVDVGGTFARELIAQGDAAMVSFATEWLTKMFGGNVGAGITRSSLTHWDAMPYVMGARSIAVPGGQPARKILAEPFGVVAFAGEATHETLYGTVGGAWESGERAAEAALKRLGALKDEPAPATKRRRG